MVLFGLAVRILCILATGSYHISLWTWHQLEMANLARSLAMGRGYSSPYVVDTGPSAWTAPIYPWLISLAFRAFGIYSDKAAFAMLAFNSFFSALTSWTIYRIARRVLDEKVACWSGWVWALLPYAIYFSAFWAWETSLTAFLLSLLFMLTLEMEGDGNPRRWVLYGLVWGIIGLTNPAPLAWLPFSGCWLVYQLHRRGRRFLVPIVLSAACFWITLAPWLIRNYHVFAEPIFIRDNFGNELHVGNNPMAEGWAVWNYHIGLEEGRLKVFQQMGEVAVNAEQGDDAKEWIANNRGRFAVLCFRRFVFFWAGLPRNADGLPRTLFGKIRNLLFLASSLLSFGGLVLAIKRRVHGVFLFATLFVAYPLVYYITFPHPRYRHPIEPELVILAVFLLLSLWVQFFPPGRQA